MWTSAQCIIAAMRLVLASASPRRAELLATAGFRFEVRSAHVDETQRPDEEPRPYVVRLATDKATAVARQMPDAVVLAADTVVVLDGELLGKPSNDDAAVAMLTKLSGRTHEVLTSVVLKTSERQLAEVASTLVRFSPLGWEEILDYVTTGEPRDKAGAYAIQGIASRFVEAIEGSYSNVVGLPVSVVYRLLKTLGVIGCS